MISIGAFTHKQDIKIAEPGHKPAARWLLLPIFAFYIVLCIVLIWVGVKAVPVVQLALRTKGLDAKTVVLENEIRAQDEKWKEFESTKEYLIKKEKWARSAPGAGEMISKILTGVSKEVKLRGFIYEYRPPQLTLPGLIRCQISIQGNIDISELTAAIRNVDERLAMLNSRRNVTQEGIQLEVEYQLR